MFKYTPNLHAAVVVGVAVTIAAVALMVKSKNVNFTFEDRRSEGEEAGAASNDDKLWEMRRDQAMKDIDAAMIKDDGIRIGNGFTRKEEEAIRLRHRVNHAFFKRCNRTMLVVENEIMQLHMRTW